MKRYVLILVPLGVLLAVAILAVPGLSSATFTSSTFSGTGTVSAADDWTPPTVSLQTPPAAVRGTVTVTATASDAGSGIKDVRIEQRAAGSADWTTVCSVASAPYTCSTDTTGATNGSYDLRAIATDKAGNTATSATVRTLVDNQAPTVTMTDPGNQLSGTRTFAATATDAHSGVAQVVIQASSNGSTWSTICTDSSSPYSCEYDTKQLTGGTYSFRAVATDKAGNTATSALVTNRVVDNAVATVTLADPGAHLAGTVNLTATGTSTAGVKSVAIQRSPAGANSWTDVCSDTSSPYACSWVTTTGTPDGLYDLRAVLTDTNGKTTTSAVVANRRVDNSPLTAVDIQTTNGGTAGRPDAGDTVIYTFSRQVNPASIVSGWNGSSRAVTASLDVGWFGSISSFEVDGANLGRIDLGARYNATLNNNISIGSTMTASTETVDGVPRTVVTVRLNSVSGSTVTVANNATMTWTPSAAVRDLLSRAASGAAVIESGTADRDF